MADAKISELTEKQTLGANDLLVIATNSNNYKVKGSTVKTYAQDGLATVATSGNYADLSNKPSIPTKTSDLTNDSDFVDSTDLATALETKQDVIDATNKLDYDYLSNTPTIPDELVELTDVNIDDTTLADGQLLKYDATSTKWVNGSGNTTTVDWSDITNKPTFATVATTGDYDDLTDTPTIPTVNNATLTITQNGVSAGTFTANASTDVTIAITDSVVSATTPLDIDTNGVISITKASTNSAGYLDITDFDYFYTKASPQTVSTISVVNATSAIDATNSNTCKKYTSPLASLTLTGTPTSDSFEQEFQFTTGTGFTFTASTLEGKWIGGTPTFEDGESYIIIVKNGLGVCAKVGA